MDQCVKGKRKAIYEVAQTQAGAGHSKAKCRKYDEEYLPLGFTHRVYTGRYSCRVVVPQQSTLDAAKRLLQIILTLCQYVINGTRHQFNVGDLSCRVASSVNSVTDYNGFYCVLPLASRVDTVFISLVRRKSLCVLLCLSEIFYFFYKLQRE